MRRHLILLALALLCAALPPATPASAATCAWTGAASSAWEAPGNWSCGAAPTASDAVTIGVIGANILISGAASAASLTMTHGSLSGPGSLSVAGLTRIQASQAVTISTSGSRLPQLEIAPDYGTVELIDPALTADSLQSLTIAATVGGANTAVLRVGDHTVGALTLASGGLNFAGTLTVTESLSWSAGRVGAPYGAEATLVLAEGATGAIPTATGGQQIAGATLINNGTIVVSGTPALSMTNSGATIARLVNNGTIEFLTTGDLSVQGNGEVRNSGTLRKGAAGLLSFGLGVSVINAGLLDLGAGRLAAVDLTLEGGELRLGGGSVRSGNNQYAQIRMTGGAITGSGTITGTIQNIGGTLAPSGRLTIIGGYTQGPTATLDLTLRGLTPGVEHGVLQLTPNQGIGGGAAINGGRLQVSAGAGFQPAAGDRFQVVICSTSCSGSFGSVSGSLSPAFGGFAGGQEIVIAEPQSAALIGAAPERASMLRGESNRYTVTIRNPTSAAISISSLAATIPISLTYQAGSSSGLLTSDPFDFANPGGGTRQLLWTTPISIPAGESRTLRFGISSAPAIPIGDYTIDLRAQVGAAQVNATRVAAISIPLGAAQAITSQASGGTLVPNTSPPALMIPRAQASQGITITARITCPFPSCGTLTTVYLEHGGRLISMTPVAAPASLGPRPLANDYGFWRGYISGPSVFPGEPTRIFPDWDDHRPCIYYDYGGGGGRPMGCVPGGDPGPVPQLYDPSGIITDATSGLPISGATVTLFRVPGAAPDTRTTDRDCRTVETRPGGVWSGAAPATGVAEDPTLRPIQIDPQVNPQQTGADGRYGWNVATGCWYVEVSAPGYITRISALVGVPPEVTDLDLALVRSAPPAGAAPAIFLPLVQR